MTDGPSASAKAGSSRAQGAAEIELEVPFYEIDPLGIVWHGHYYKYFDRARTALLGAHDLDGMRLIETGFKFLVVESNCKHMAPLTYGERMRVSARFGRVTHRVEILFEVTSLSTGKRVAKGRTDLATVDEQGQLRLRTPATILERIEQRTP